MTPDSLQRAVQRFDITPMTVVLTDLAQWPEHYNVA